jgi:hypothetical protein
MSWLADLIIAAAAIGYALATRMPRATADVEPDTTQRAVDALLGTHREVTS